ncbi:MAG TPA: serine protease [Stellaceae bacterium]|nr:serine protease [Stellaceae bacterium]
MWLPSLRQLVGTAVLVLAMSTVPAWAADVAPPESAALSTTAETVYAAARPQLLQIRTILDAAGRQYVLGSGFIVSSDGLAITNYHVVSEYALEPQTYRLEYAMADGTHGNLQLVALDVANDLAVVRLDRRNPNYFQFSAPAIAGELPKGERLFSMGNPLDLGFTIVEGTYNGPVERTYNQRLHFSGAINPGMSGGPAVAADGKVVGVNVSHEIGGELVSFLVPVRFAAELLARAQEQPSPPKDLTVEIGRQFTLWQAGLYRSFDALGFRAVAIGDYEAPESTAPWFQCWGRTNAGQVPKPRAVVDTSMCSSDTELFIANDLTTGRIRLVHSYVKSTSLNEFQFAAFLSRQARPGLGRGWSRKWQTRERCHEDFVAVATGTRRLPLRAVWCARAYRAFPGLYDVALTAVTQDNGDEALAVELDMQGVLYRTAMTLGEHFLKAVRWTK